MTTDFDHTHRGYRFLCETDDADKSGDSTITISKGGEEVRKFRWPSYKIWNIPAHADDIVDGLEQDSNDGLYVAGEVGFGANVFSEQRREDES